MLKLRNAVLTALLAFCLAMPFVSCSFNDGATGDVSGEVKVQSDNNQNGGNENPSGGDNGGNENPSGGNNGGSGNENPSGGDSGTDYPGTDEPGSGDETMYTVMYNGKVLDTISAEEFSAYSGLLKADTDYTIIGTVITLTDSGYQKVLPLLGSSGGDGGQEPGTDEPGTDYPGTDVPGDVEGTMYTVKYGDTVIVPAMPESALSSFETACGLKEGTDYTISGTVITLKDSGFEKVKAAGSGAGE